MKYAKMPKVKEKKEFIGFNVNQTEKKIIVDAAKKQSRSISNYLRLFIFGDNIEGDQE